MSRIHEALKQAKHGQDPAPLAELVATIPSTAASQLGSGFDRTNLSGLPVSGQAPDVPNSSCAGLDDLRNRCVRRVWKLDPAYCVFSGTRPRAELAEQFRKLRSKLYEMRKSQSLQTLVITSTVPAEGKTFVALNLALAITRQNGRRVLLIDGDLRMPKLASCLGVPSFPGLTEFVRGAADESSILQSDSESGLFFIAAGEIAANPTEMLASERLQWLLARMTPLFDWIIVDAPPVLPVSDAGALAGHCDGVLVVVRAGSTGYDSVGAALKELRGKKVLGVVLNLADRRESFCDANSYYAGQRTPSA
jgi:capsular exopolysaccharide synthesis family protein